MRKVRIFCTSEMEVDTKLFDYLTKENSNSLIKFDTKDREFYFHSKYKDQKEKVIIYGDVLEYNEKLVLDLKEILRHSFKQIGDISSEDHGPFHENIIFSPIENYINFCSYESNVPKTIFHFVANLFYKYSAGHLLKNGNKRLSFLFMINTLYYLGFYFFYSKGKMLNYSMYEEVIVEWVEKTNNLTLKPGGIEKYINKLAEWIKDNSIIALNWR